MDEISRVMVAVDESSCSVNALDAAITIAKQVSAELKIVTVVQTVSAVISAPINFSGVALPPETFDVRRSAEKLMQRMSDIARVSDVGFTTEIIDPETNDIPGAIVNSAVKFKADIIVIGQRDIGRLERAFTGSVSRGVISKAVCPVLIVK